MTTLSIDTTRRLPAAGRWAGLAGLAQGDDPDARDRAFVLLHGLTFDRRMWEPVLGALPLRHRAIALDLPGHGQSAPIVVGHSVGGAIAGIYGATYPTAAVVSVEAPIDVLPFAMTARAMEPQLT